MITASAVSRTLRRGGLNPLGSGTSRNREGLRVSDSLRTGSLRRVRVTADLDSEYAAGQMIEAAADILAAADYGVELNDDGQSLYAYGV